MAAFYLHVFLFQQTVRSLCEATHVSLTLTLPPTTEYWHMDGSYILKGSQLSQYASKHFSMDYVELHIKVRLCVRMGVRAGDHMPCQSDGDSWNHLQSNFNYCLLFKDPGYLGCFFFNMETCRQAYTHTCVRLHRQTHHWEPNLGLMSCIRFSREMEPIVTV